MTRRSSRVWTFAVAWLGALAVSAHVSAKPPDLPVNPNDTVPNLTPPPFDMSPPGDEVAPPQAEVAPPMPEPLPGWPTVMVYSVDPFVLIYNGDPSAWQPVKQEIHATTLTFYPGPHGAVVSIDPWAKAAPQTMTIYHPVRPRVPVSVACTFDKCLLFGANPLLALVPLPESMREEQHTTEEVPVPPMQEAQPDGQLMFGVGVNSDAGLTGIIEITTPQRIEGAFPPPAQFNTIPGNNNLLAGITPAGSLTPDLSIPCSPGPQEAGAGAKDSDPPTCPYPCDRFVPAIADMELSDLIMGSLAKVIEAETLYQQACQLVKNAQYAEAIACLKKACALCPVSRYQEMSAELVSSMVWRYFSGRHEDADTEEQAEPPTECEPYWYGDDDGLRCPSESKHDQDCPPAVKKQEMPSCGSHVCGFGIDVIIERKSSPMIEMARKLTTLATVKVKDMPLRQVIEDLGQQYCLNFDIDDAALLGAGISIDQPVTLQLEGVTLKTVLEVLFRKCNIVYIVNDSYIEITVAEEAKRPPVRGPFSVLELKVPGVEEQVTGLIKACHLALSCGRYAKAAQLAREANALDAERVAADPIVYKMHILALKIDKGKCCCDKDCCCDPCDDPGCCCPAKQANECRQSMSQCVPPMPTCPAVEMLPPAMPPVDPSIVLELQKVFEEANVEVSNAKPNLEVVEEESEAQEVPKAVAKPFRVQASQAESVITYDDLLRFIPGETWTEIDLRTNRVRVLWRVHVGDKVYRVRYDGGFSVDLSVAPPMGSAEKCEDPR